MDEAVIWVPTVKVCQSERTSDFTLLRYGTKEGHGSSFVVGPLVQISKEEMAHNGLEIIHDALDFYKIWPADTNFNSELKTMGVAKRSKFITTHRFVSISRLDEHFIGIKPQHRLGGGWRGITGYPREEKRFRLPMTQDEFYRELMLAFDRAT